MNQDLRVIRDLLQSQRVLALGLIVDSSPLVSLLPFALESDFTAAYVHASTLARHSRGLRSGAAFSALVHAPDRPDQDALQVPRLTINGGVTALQRDTAAYDAAREIYLRRFPDSAVTFELGDFSLYRLNFRDARFVQGFARAGDISLDDFRAMSI